MAYPNITSLKKASVVSANYFVDANVWIYALQDFESLEWWGKLYVEFFYKIIESNLNPQPKILLPALLLSEIVNTYIRQIAIPEYKLQNQIPASPPFEFKKNYRHTQHYKDSFEKLMDDISALRSSISLLGDELIISDPSIMFLNTLGKLDYNDYLYYSICKEFNKSSRLIMLTNDSDFEVSDIEIITANKSLLV